MLEISQYKTGPKQAANKTIQRVRKLEMPLRRYAFGQTFRVELTGIIEWQGKFHHRLRAALNGVMVKQVERWVHDARQQTSSGFEDASSLK